MPLDNTAKLADIITALQTMEGINAKAELASVVGSPANADDTMATINSVIQGAKNTLAAKMADGSSEVEPLQNLVNKLVGSSKKWASGSVVSSAGQKRFQYSTGSYVDCEYLQITGITFAPKVFIATDLTGIVSAVIHFSEGLNKNGNLLGTSQIGGNFFTNYNVSVVPGSIILPATGPSKNLNWIAFE